MRYDKTRKILIFWCLFIGIGAVAGGVGMLVDSTGKAMGMDTMLQYFRVLPFSDILFQNYIFSGISLLIVNGITNIIASILLLKKKKLGIILGGIWGITLMLWITIQFVIFPMNFMSTIYFIFGLLQAITGYMCYVFYNQENFIVNEKEYKNIATNNNEIVVYFSRMGYTKKIALEIANKSGAQILEIKTKEKTEGTLGFWWCGRFGIHGWSMPIEKVKQDLGKYDKATICTPIWVFGISAPIKEFCKQYSGKLKNVDYVFVHFMNAKFTMLADEIDDTLKIKRNKLITICSRLGKTKYTRGV